MAISKERTVAPREPAAFGRTTLHRPRRRRVRRVIVVVTALLVALCLSLVVAATAPLREELGHRLGISTSDHVDYLGTNGWPATGQGAYQVDHDTPHVSAGQRQAPIASVAKVMTALVVVKQHPLEPGADGPSLSVTAADVADTLQRRTGDESVVPVAEGESLTERQALEALLLPSANNVARMLAAWSAGSVKEFVADMNTESKRLHMDATHYTDPSGLAVETTSTAADQLKLAEAVAKVDVLAQIMAMSSAEIPVAGRVHNTDTLLGHDGFVGMKTGSTDAAGGCFMFRARRVLNGKQVQVIGVVLGQPGHDGRPLWEAGLNAARQLVEQVAPS